MNIRNLKVRTLLTALVAALALPFAMLLFQPAVAEDRAIDSEITKVLQERLAVLQEAAKLQRQAYRNGATSLSAVLTADQTALHAELELAASAADRVRIREEILKNAELLEKAVETLVKSAEGPRFDLLAARANRLRAQADLMIERKAAAR